MERTIRVNGIDLNFWDSDPDDAESRPVVMVHGLGGCWQAWDFQRLFLEERGGFRTLAVDLRGHGASSKPHSPYTVELLADDVARAIEKLGCGRVCLIGHSLGGMVSMQLAGTRPDLVARLVVINSFARIPRVSLKMIAKLLLRTTIIYGFGMPAWGRYLCWELLPRRDQKDLRARFLELSRSCNDRTAYVNSLQAAVKADLRPVLGRIECPVKFLAAAHDYTPTSAKLGDARLINNRNPRAQPPQATVVEIPRSRHLSLWDQAALVNSEILSFLAGKG
jgi:pimeloyl-ACP methyl ester carboxylesterase